MSLSSTRSSSDIDFERFQQLARLSKERPIWLRVGQLIDGVSDRAIVNADLIFDQLQIRFVGTSGQRPEPDQVPAGQSAPDAVLSDYSVLPCLIEAHAHMFLDGAPIDFATREAYLKKPADWMLERAQARWKKMSQCGIGTVRDAGDKHGVGLALASAAKLRLSKPSTSPWIDSPGAAIHHRGRYGSFMAEPIEQYAGPEECVAARVSAGANRIKLLATGIINFKVGQVTTAPQMSAPEVAALVNAAAHHDKQTFAHASGTDGIENSIEGGVTTVEHGFFITEQQLAKMRDRKIAWTPTFAPVQLQLDRAQELGWNSEVVVHLQRILADHGRMLCKAHQLGVTVLAGSDAGSCGVPHGIGLLREMQQMEAAGMPAMAVLKAATGASAATLNFPERVGRIAPDCRTRLIFTQHDPLKTVANLQRNKIVWFDESVVASNAHSDSDKADNDAAAEFDLAGL